MTAVKRLRKTRETDIVLAFELRGKGTANIATGVGFFDHMLELFAFHGCFDLNVTCQGDLEVDAHHTVEDVGLVLGDAFQESFKKNPALVRYADAFVAMDESLARAVVDISGRPFLVFRAGLAGPQVGTFDTELVQEFFRAFATRAAITLHLELCYGDNTHHQIEALFKAAAVAIRRAVQIDDVRQGPSSTKYANS